MNKSQRIVKQAGILALAGILVRIIGVLYRSPLTAMIGDEGNGYYSTAYNIYSLVLLISSYSIPTAISKLISEKIVLNQYDHARKIFKYAILYVTVVSGIAALLAFVLAPWIVPKLSIHPSHRFLNRSSMPLFPFLPHTYLSSHISISPISKQAWVLVVVR